MNLSKHFTLGEFIHSDIAVRKGIDNTPTEEIINNLKALCTNVLEPIREYFKKPIRISSGYRSLALNKAIGGSKTSQHCLGCAVDFTVQDISVDEVFKNIIKMSINFDQNIQEFSAWSHISYLKSGNRRQNLIAKKVNGKTVYEKYIV